MGIRYEHAEDIQREINEIARMLFPHVKLDSVVCIRSYGSSSRGTIARCHALGKAMQIALGRKGFYVIEVISKRFDKLPNEDKIKTLIHELMHIPKSFGGGFIHHNVVHEKNVERVYEHYANLKKVQERWFPEHIETKEPENFNLNELINKENNNPDSFSVKKKKGFWF
ncbi:MAG: putative metallopeptidase [Nanoarchaeota archaeon]|nr:putative metallopeptidase [Nanoarchaeota archaeon]